MSNLSVQPEVSNFSVQIVVEARYPTLVSNFRTSTPALTKEKRKPMSAVNLRAAETNDYRGRKSKAKQKEDKNEKQSISKRPGIFSRGNFRR